MPIILIEPAVVGDADLLFTVDETRQIFRFFWPGLAASIQLLEVADTHRRFAQQLLISGIDSSYALGFMQKLLETALKPRAGFTGLASMGRKLARHYIPHWWKHATRKDLENPRIAEAVRVAIANNFQSPINLLLQNAGYRPVMGRLQIAATATTVFWGAA